MTHSTDGAVYKQTLSAHQQSHRAARTDPPPAAVIASTMFMEPYPDEFAVPVLISYAVNDRVTNAAADTWQYGLLLKRLLVHCLAKVYGRMLRFHLLLGAPSSPIQVESQPVGVVVCQASPRRGLLIIHTDDLPQDVVGE